MNNTDKDSEEARHSQTVSDACQPSNTALDPDKDNASDSGQGGSLTARAGSAAPARPTAHRAPPAMLDPDRAASFGQAVAAICDADATAWDRSRVIEWMGQQVAPLANATSDEAIARLSCHVPFLEAIMISFGKRAASAPNADAAAKMAKLSLAAQVGATRTIALIAELKGRQPRPVVSVEDDET